MADPSPLRYPIHSSPSESVYSYNTRSHVEPDIDRASLILERILTTQDETRITHGHRRALTRYYLTSPSENYEANRRSTALTIRNEAYRYLEKLPELQGFSRSDIRESLHFIRCRRFRDSVLRWVEGRGPLPEPFEFSNTAYSSRRASQHLDDSIGISCSRYKRGILTPHPLPGCGYAVDLTVDGVLKRRFLIGLEGSGLLERNDLPFLSDNFSPSEALLRLLYVAPPIDLNLALAKRKVNHFENVERVSLLPKRICRGSAALCSIPRSLSRSNIALVIKRDDLERKIPRVYLGVVGAKEPFLSLTLYREGGFINARRELLGGIPKGLARSANSYREYLRFEIDANYATPVVAGLKVYQTQRSPNGTQKRIQFGSKQISLPSSYPHASADIGGIRLTSDFRALGVWEPGEDQAHAPPVLIVKRTEKGWERVWENKAKIAHWMSDTSN